MTATHTSDTVSRTSQRIPISSEVHVRAEGRPEQLLLSHDWSEAGVFVRTRHPYPVGTLVEVAVAVPEVHGLVRTRGQVMRSIAPSADLDVVPGMGLRLFEMPPALEAHLQRLSQERRHPAARRSRHCLLLVGEPRERLKHAVYLAAMGFTVAEADDSAQAEPLLVHGLAPEIAVVFAGDEPAPITLAVELFRRLLRHPPRTILTVGESEKALVEAARAHASVVAPGPLSPEQLFAMVMALLPSHDHEAAEPPHS